MERIATWPNAVTVIRMFFGAYGIYIATLSQYFWQGVAIFLVLGLLPDLLDGWLARALDQKTRLGEFLDPFVDKILFYLAIFVLFSENVWWAGLYLLLACDIISTVLHFFKNGGAVKSGKRKFLLQNCALGLFVFGKIINVDYIYIVANAVMVSAIFFSLHSLWSRFRR